MAQLQPTVVDGTLNSLVTENVKTSSHTLALADRDKVVAFNGTSAQVVTIPTDSVAFPIGSIVYIGRYNTGTLTLAAASGVTVSKTGTFAINEEVYVRKRASNTWIVVDSPRNLSGTGGSVATAGSYKFHTFTSGTGTFTLG
jgi:hypothetical protein